MFIRSAFMEESAICPDFCVYTEKMCIRDRQEASQVAGQENETENKEQAEEYAADSAAEVQTDETEAAENRTAADKSREQAEPQTAQTGEQAEPQTAQTGEQAASEAEPQAQVQPRAVVAVLSLIHI